jgi:dihydrolipoamide dehydrogenase
MTFDAIVIGSGQAGVPLATRLANEGKRVLLAERGDLGGTCVNTGCTPTKTMIASARAAHVARSAGRLGVHAKEVTVDFAKVVERKNAIVAQWREGVSKKIATDRLTLVHGHARFAGEKKVEVGGQVHTAETIVINVGARPNVPPLEGLDQVPWLDNERAMNLRELPSHLLVLGGGYIGCELGQMFRRFGARVSIVEGHDHLLANQDADVSEALEKALRKEEIELHLGERVTRVSGRAGDVAVKLESGKELRGSHLLVAVGRKPNTSDLGCDRAGVNLDQRGYVAVDDHYQTSAAGIYAVGDVTGGPQFTHTSWDDHRLLFDILRGHASHGRSGRFIPFTAFTDPQVAGVGLTEKEARKRGVNYEVASMPFGNVARAVEVDETEGVMKVLVDPANERVLGAAIVGAEAGELIHIFVTLMQAKASARAIVDAEFVHPTFSEGVQSLVMKLDRFALR